MVLVGDGYLLGTAPPQMRSPAGAISAAFNLARAHRLATAKLHKIQPVRTPNKPGTPLRGVGLVNGLDIYDPFNPADLQDAIVTELVRDFANWALPQSAVYGAFDMAETLSKLSGSAVHAPAALVDPPSRGSPVVD